MLQLTLKTAGCLLLLLSLGHEAAASQLSGLRTMLNRDGQSPTSSPARDVSQKADVSRRSNMFQMPNLYMDSDHSCDPGFVLEPPRGRYFILNLYPREKPSTSWSPTEAKPTTAPADKTAP